MHQTVRHYPATYLHPAKVYFFNGRSLTLQYQTKTSMQQQNFKNHPRFVPLYHYILSLVILAILILSIINLVQLGISHQTVLLFLMALALCFIFWLLRSFPLAVQDRAIRAEESLRFYVLTGKLPDSRLTKSQIIALRFAPDEELLALAERAVKENLSNKEIKQAIQNWRADHDRA
jgi:Family of unknown function (DUF6526)